MWLALLGTLLLTAACSSQTGSPPVPAPSLAHPSGSQSSVPESFVKRAGDHLVLGGRPYQFVGLNMYAAANRGGCNLTGPLSAVLPAYARTVRGHFVIRAWAFPPYSQEPTAPYDWSGLDHLVAVAGRYHVRLILVLDDQWGTCEPGGPGYKTAAWYARGYAGVYRSWVEHIVTRYRASPTILAWELMNEAEVAQTPGGPCAPNAHQLLLRFTQTMSALVKRLDPNHLLGLGTIGGGQCGAVNSDPKQYLDLHRIPEIDFCEVHTYPLQVPLAVGARIRQCRSIGKPLVVGEYGLRPQDTGGLRGRASRAARDLSTYLRLGAAGVLLWGVQPDAYNIAVGDPVLSALPQVGSN